MKHTGLGLLYLATLTRPTSAAATALWPRHATHAATAAVAMAATAIGRVVRFIRVVRSMSIDPMHPYRIKFDRVHRFTTRPDPTLVSARSALHPLKQGTDLIDLRQLLERVVFCMDPFGSRGGCYDLQTALEARSDFLHRGAVTRGRCISSQRGWVVCWGLSPAHLTSLLTFQRVQGAAGRHAAQPEDPPSRGRGRGEGGLRRLQGPLPVHLPLRAGGRAEDAAGRDGGQPLAPRLLEQRAPAPLPLDPVPAGIRTYESGSVEVAI